MVMLLEKCRGIVQHDYGLDDLSAAERFAVAASERSPVAGASRALDADALEALGAAIRRHVAGGVLDGGQSNHLRRSGAEGWTTREAAQRWGASHDARALLDSKLPTSAQRVTMSLCFDATLRLSPFSAWLVVTTRGMGHLNMTALTPARASLTDTYHPTAAIRRTARLRRLLAWMPSTC